VDRTKFQPIHNELRRLFNENRKGVWKVPIVTLNTHGNVHNYILNNLSEKSQISKYKTDKGLHPNEH